MGAIAEMTHKGKEFNDGNDAIVIRRVGACLIGGRTLDMTGFPEDHVNAGHIIIREAETDTYKPMPVSNGAYGSLPTGFAYVGVLRASKPKEQPFASIMYEGEVNDIASPYEVTAAMKTALKVVLPGLYFMHD